MGTKSKELAIKLRRKGMSYRQINKQLQISKSTLNYWFSNKKWSADIKKKLIYDDKEKMIIRMKKLSLKSKRKREILYKNMRDEATNSYNENKKDTLFVAGLMTYWGEGDKTLNNGQLRVANSDAGIVRYYYFFLKKYFPELSKKAKMYLVLYPDLDEKDCIKNWADKIGISLDSFYKSQYIIGRSGKRKLKYGVGTLTVCSKAYKHKLLQWIRLLESDILKMR